MTTVLKTIILFLLAGWAITTSASAANPASSPSSQPANNSDAAYSAAIEKRTADILAVLNLTDPNKTSAVHDTILAHYRDLKDWHDQNDAKLKQLKKNSDKNDPTLKEITDSLKTLHDQFLAKLAVDLTLAQIDQVKDKLVYNKVQVTYDAYVQIVPGLNDQEKAAILEMLKQAREEAMDAGSADEKSAVFRKYKGKINIYLGKQGHDVNKAYKNWGNAQRTKQDAASQPATDPMQ